jgi:hypothetical protein
MSILIFLLVFRLYTASLFYSPLLPVFVRLLKRSIFIDNIFTVNKERVMPVQINFHQLSEFVLKYPNKVGMINILLNCLQAK